MAIDPTIKSGWNRVAMAIDEIRERMLRAAATLESAHVDYAVLGGNAVAEWVGRADKTAVRFTRDVDILLRREDMPKAIEAMETAGFQFEEVMNVPMFIDGPNGTAKNAVHVLYAGEKVRETDSMPTPTLEAIEDAEGFKVVTLESLVTMKLTSYRRKDQVHLEDMLEVGIIDASWVARFEDPLGERLQFLIDNPE